MRHLGFLFALAAMLLANTAEAGRHSRGRHNCCEQTQCRTHNHCGRQNHHNHCGACQTCCAPAPSCDSCQACSAPAPSCGACQTCCASAQNCGGCGNGCGTGGCGVAAPVHQAAPAPVAPPAVENAPAPPAEAPPAPAPAPAA